MWVAYICHVAEVDNRPGRQLMVESNVGVRICIGLLDKMVTFHEAEEGSEGARAFDIG
jgi:ataxin-10